MLAANEAVAAHIEAAGEPMIFRIHDRPDPKRVIEFEEIATGRHNTVTMQEEQAAAPPAP